jgi:hypothetical protein
VGSVDLDLEKFLLPEEVEPYKARAGAKAKTSALAKRRKKQFIMVPLTWWDQLQTAKRASTLKVALYLLFQHWKGNKRPVRLSNIALTEAAVSRWQKWRALAELERLKLIRVERRPRKSPVITVLV